MAGFGYIYSAYGIVLLLEILFIYRGTLVKLKKQASGFMKTIYEILSMGSDNIGPRALALDHKVIGFLAAIGIPMACILHGYVGFIFGGVKANSLWATPLMPVIFLLSACVSGIAGIIVTYLIIKPRAADSECIRSCIKFLCGFFILDFVFEMLEIGMHAYQSTHHWHALHELFWGPLYQSYWIYQVLIFSVIPFFILMGLSLIRFPDLIVKLFAFIASGMILFQVLLMRWNVVIGGQLMSKSEQGVVGFHPEWIDKEGIIPAIIIMVLPIIILFILSKVFPFWLPAESASNSSK